MCEKCLDVTAIKLRWLGGDYQDMEPDLSNADIESKRYAVRMECGRVVVYTQCVPRHFNPNKSKRTAYRINEETNKKVTQEDIINKVETRLYRPLATEIAKVKTTVWQNLEDNETDVVIAEDGFIQY